MSKYKRKRNNNVDGCGGFLYMFLFAGICFLLFSGVEKLIGLIPSSSSPSPYRSPTPEKGYVGDCHHWTDAANYVGEVTCIWGVATNAVTGDWVWLHFSYRSEPYPDFAADLEDHFESDFYFSANNVDKIYSGHCVEVYGLVKIEPNTYDGKTVNQPVIHVTRQEQLKICDYLLK